ncbi:MAG: hypothetical protein JWQ68_118, partial [Cryobacterium sp.]|nr:hypothetical protein [Cryobacterium sp.]
MLDELGELSGARLEGALDIDEEARMFLYL